MFLSNKTQDLNFSQDINDLLCQIDTWIAAESKRKLDSERFGAKICINMDDYELLNKYRFILHNKGKNSCCLRGYLIDDIISRIKQLINRN